MKELIRNIKRMADHYFRKNETTITLQEDTNGERKEAHFQEK